MHQSEVKPSGEIPIAGFPVASKGKLIDLHRVGTNLAIFLITLLTFYFINKKGLVYDGRYIQLLPVILGAWFIGGFLSKKFKVNEEHVFIVRAKRSYMSLLYSLGTIGLFLIWSDFSISRFVIVGSFLALFIFELSIEFFASKQVFNIHLGRIKSISYLLFLVDFTLLTFVLLTSYELKIGLKAWDKNQLILVVATYLSWLIASVIVHQFVPFGKALSFRQSLTRHLQAYLLIIALTSFVVYILQLPDAYRSLYISALILYSGISFIIFSIIYLDKIPQKTDEIKHDFLHAYELKVPQRKFETSLVDSRYTLHDSKKDDKLYSRMRFQYLKEFPLIFDFLDRSLDLETFHLEYTHIIRSGDPYNISVLSANQTDMLINLHQLNDIRILNEYFININQKLIDGGVFVGNFEPIRFRFKRFIHKYPFLISHFLYTLDFIWYRLLPKLPILRKIFFAYSKGKNRAISLAEGLGRLYYSGFDILDLKEIDDKCYFVAKKVSQPLLDVHPSYSLIFKMKRYGKDGKLIYVYKLRTMHPYSEFLQEFVYKNNDLEIGGKFKDDFRITKWGRIFRKLWIDELPMMINWFKGDCKLVGVRPLSNHYLSLYGEEFRQKRMKYKPGLVPPYYVDLPKDLNEIMASEKKYLDEFDKYGYKADIRYLYKAVKNILVYRQRSN